MPRKRRQNKRIYGCPRTKGAKAAYTISVSIYPRHMCMLKQREKELGVSRSVLVQLLCEVEDRDCLLRPELLRRLEPGPVKQLTAVAA